MTEEQFQGQVLRLAKLCGWLAYHTRDSRRSRAGFPDLVLVKRRVVYAELKSAAGKTSPEQEEWLARLRAAGQEVYLWRPGDLQRVADVLAT